MPDETGDFSDQELAKLLLAFSYGRKGRPFTEREAEVVLHWFRQVLINWSITNLVLKGRLVFDLQDGEPAFTDAATFLSEEDWRGLQQRRKEIDRRPDGDNVR